MDGEPEPVAAYPEARSYFPPAQPPTDVTARPGCWMAGLPTDAIPEAAPVGASPHRISPHGGDRATPNKRSLRCRVILGWWVGWCLVVCSAMLLLAINETRVLTIMVEGADNRVVGKNAWTPQGCNDLIMSVLWIAHLIFIIVLFFIWVGDGAPGFPSGHIDNLIDDTLTTTNGTLTPIASATALTAFYSLLFSILWLFLFLLIMKAAALVLIILINIIMILCWLGFGAGLLYNAATCRSRTALANDITGLTGACGDSEFYGTLIGGILLLGCGVRRQDLISASIHWRSYLSLSVCKVSGSEDCWCDSHSDRPCMPSGCAASALAST